MYYLGFSAIHRFADREFLSVEARLATFSDNNYYIVESKEKTSLDLAVNGYYIFNPIELVFTCKLCFTTVENVIYILDDTPTINFAICSCPVNYSVTTDHINGNKSISLFGDNVTITSKVLNMPSSCVYCKAVVTVGHYSSCIFYNHSITKKSLSTCVICLEPATVMFPCKHVACCPSCTLSINVCPICRSSVDYFKILNFRV